MKPNAMHTGQVPLIQRHSHRPTLCPQLHCPQEVIETFLGYVISCPAPFPATTLGYIPSQTLNHVKFLIHFVPWQVLDTSIKITTIYVIYTHIRQYVYIYFFKGLFYFIGSMARGLLGFSRLLLHLMVAVLGFQRHATAPSFYVGSGESKVGSSCLCGKCFIH